MWKYYLNTIFNIFIQKTLSSFLNTIKKEKEEIIFF